MLEKLKIQNIMNKRSSRTARKALKVAVLNSIVIFGIIIYLIFKNS